MGRLTTRQLARKRDRQNRFNPRAELQPGDMLQERYRVVGMLGVGGMSSVYQARDMRFPTVTKLCAVKEMVIATSDPQLRQLTIKSFEREASMLAMLDHPAIPDVSDYFTDGNRSYLVQELIRGKNLQEWLEETEAYITQEMALDWSLQVCEALAYLHGQKPQPIVFRDLKPSNIMLDQYDRIRLIDFGIAKIFEAEENKGTMIGTEGYSPPEQYRGEATPAVDIYALGATLHHLMTRQDPRLEAPFTFSERPIHASNPHISRAFEAIVMRCLSYNPLDRFPDAMALREALELIAQPAPSQAAIDKLVAPKTTTGSPPIAQPQQHQPTITAVTTAIQVGATQAEPIWSFKCEDESRSKALVSEGRV
ncbi:MAG: serine/threonine-protein kinase, partial [Chloroflexota bacterium]